MDPDPNFPFNTDPEPNFHLKKDSDPNFLLNTDAETIFNFNTDSDPVVDKIALASKFHGQEISKQGFFGIKFGNI